MTWRTCPFGPLPAAIRFSCVLVSAITGDLRAMSNVPHISKLERLGAGNDLDQLLSDHGLSRAIISERQAPDHVAGIARGVVHGAHALALLRRCVLEQRAEGLRGDFERQKIGEDICL